MFERLDMRVSAELVKRLNISFHKEGEELARASLIFINNKLHNKPYALLEDVFVDERSRGYGLGKEIVKQAVKLARNSNCYKILANVNDEQIKQWYVKKLGFKESSKNVIEIYFD